MTIDCGLNPSGGSDFDATGTVNPDAENPNVIVSGWQVYNNKGKVVEKYEPYYDKGFDYIPPLLYKASLSGLGEEHPQRTATQALNLSQKIRMFYDPRGQVIRTVNPDGTEQRIIFGVPRFLDTPSQYTPTPWEQYSYDANDLKPLTHPADTSVPDEHEYTPSSTLIDAMGRTVKTTDRNYKSGAIEEIVMQYEYDIRGNLLTVTDPYSRTVFSHAYDWANRPLRTTHIDGGTKYSVMDCMNKPMELRDEKGALLLTIYDELNRPLKIWARDNSEEAITLRQRMHYGDSSSLIDPEANNLKGKLYRHYDEAGLTTIAAYDFKGQVPEKIRRVIKDEALLSVFDGPPTDWQVQAYRVDWDNSDDTILEAKEYVTSMEYDALGRVTKMVYPEDVDSERKILLPAYNRSGALESVQLKDNELATPVTYVDRIAYNARGQKILSALGNGTMTRYQYRSDNFRLLRMKSEGYEKTLYGGTVTYEKKSGTIKQNFTYEYDLAGNIVSITDTTTGCGVANSNELVREFEYDALYRLLSATGRETANTGSLPWQDTYRPANATHSRAYTQHYDYDKLGNIWELQHVASGGNFTRTFNYDDPATNKLSSIDIGANNYSFTYDVNGNMQSEDSNRHFAYDYADRLKAFYLQASTEEPSQYTQYFYDAGGNRVKKISRVQGGTSTRTTVYIDGIFEHTLTNTSDAIPDLEIGSWTIGYGSGEQNTLHIMDGTSRIATRRIGDDMDDTTPAIKYNLEDHLGSSNLLLDADGVLVSREEYYPFGETSFGSFGKKRYRFCGKEKDEESGLYYYGLRYYNPWTCRFINIDPLAAKYPFYTPYQYAGNKPINFIDLDGAEPDGGTTQGGGDPPDLAQGDLGEVKMLPEIEVTGTCPPPVDLSGVNNIAQEKFGANVSESTGISKPPVAPDAKSKSEEGWPIVKEYEPGVMEEIHTILKSPQMKAIDPTGSIAGGYELLDQATIVGTTVGSKIGLASAPQNLEGNVVDQNQKEGALVILLAVAVSSTSNPNTASGLGDLTKKEVAYIQNGVNAAGRPIEIVGSAAKGTRRGVGTDLPIGKGPGTKSDIDYIASPGAHPYFEEVKFPDMDPSTGIIPGQGNPFIGPVIKFEPYGSPTFIPMH